MKNKIVFDANPMVATNKTGVGMYTLRFIEALAKLNDVELIGYYYDFLGKQSLDVPVITGVTYKPIRLYPGRFVNLLRRLGLELPVEFLSKTKAPIALYPNFVAQPSLFKAKSFAVVHDLTYIDHPEYSSDRNQTFLEHFVPKTLDRCAGIMTVSEDSRQKIAGHYGYDKNKILVTPIPPEDKYEISDESAKKIIADYKINKPYILFLGTLEPRKNLITLLEAYEQNAKLNEKYSLVLAGGMDWKFEDIAKKIEQMQNAGLNVVHCGYVSAEERAVLYSQASVYTLPSHYEGFGMPILEAMQYNAPVAISDIAVFHEVAEDAALYFNKDDPKDMGDKLLLLLSDIDLRKKLIGKGTRRLNSLSWDKIARETIEFINKVK